MTQENWMKIEGARGKNVRGSIFLIFWQNLQGAILGPKNPFFIISMTKWGAPTWIILVFL